MSDDKQNRGPADRARINMSEDYEVQYWTRELGITRDELQRAVDNAGNAAESVRRYLES